MERILNLILSIFFVLSLLMCAMSYINIDPIKSSLLLIFSLIFTIPLITFLMYVWFSYFICLLFLSGIFVILVYFSSLSKLNEDSRVFVIVRFFVRITIFFPVFYFYFESARLNNFYYDVHWIVFIVVVILLLFFINFSSYFLNFSGALRKI